MISTSLNLDLQQLHQRFLDYLQLVLLSNSKKQKETESIRLVKSVK